MDIRVRPGRHVVNGWREYVIISDNRAVSCAVGTGESSGYRPVMCVDRFLPSEEGRAVLTCAAEFEG